MFAQRHKSKENNSSTANAVSKFSNHLNHGDNFVDNRSEVASQRKLINIIQSNSKTSRALCQFKNYLICNNKNYIKQLYKVPDDHIRADLRHEDSHRLFLEDTIEDIEGRLGGEISSEFSNIQLDEAVRSCRDEQKMDYNQLSKRKLTSEKQITSFLNERPEDEHMYVLDNNEHHVAIRSEDVKLPHPTLVGGDPDVDCAGTMRWGQNKTVVVDDGSGHFRPGGAGPAEQKLNKIMNKTARKRFKKKIKRGKRQ